MELNRRKELGESFSRLLSTQLRLLESLEADKQTHRILFDAVVKEVRRTLETLRTAPREQQGLKFRFDTYS